MSRPMPCGCLTRIKLHMRAGICEYKTTDFSLRQVAEKANVACLETSIHDVQIFNEKMQESIFWTITRGNTYIGFKINYSPDAHRLEEFIKHLESISKDDFPDIDDDIDTGDENSWDLHIYYNRITYIMRSFI